MNLTEAHPASNKPSDVNAKDRLDGIHNRWFLDAIFKGVYPQDILNKLYEFMPKNFEDDMSLISEPIDWLGINYYTRGIVADDPGEPWPSLKDIEGSMDKTQMGWEIYPEGLKNLLVRVSRNYTGNLPLLVTENGMACADEIQNEIVSVSYTHLTLPTNREV